MPWHPFPEKLTRKTQYLPVATAYSRPDLFDDWQPTLIVHALVAILLATPIAVAHSLILSFRGQSEPATFSLRGLLLGTGMLAMILGGLRWYAAPPVVMCAVLILSSGYPVTVIVAGLLSRRMTKGGVQSGTEFPRNTDQPQGSASRNQSSADR